MLSAFSILLVIRVIALYKCQICNYMPYGGIWLVVIARRTLWLKMSKSIPLKECQTQEIMNNVESERRRRWRNRGLRGGKKDRRINFKFGGITEFLHLNWVCRMQGSKYRISGSYRMRVFHIGYQISGEISRIHAHIGRSYRTLYNKIFITKSLFSVIISST